MQAPEGWICLSDEGVSQVSVINVQDLTMVYKTSVRKEGLEAAFAPLFHRTYREIRVVQGISFEVTAGSVVGFIDRIRGSHGANPGGNSNA